MSLKETPQRLSLLIVEHDQEAALAAGAALREAGHGVTSASSREALAAARSCRPDVVLLNRDLPGSDALEVCQRLKADPALAHAFVVLTSSSPAPGNDLPLDFDGYISRAVEDSEYCLQVHAYGRLARLTRSLREQATRAHAHVEDLRRVERDAEDRARDLSDANAALVDSRRAALNLIDDALEARRALESANVELRAEVAERRRVEDALRKISAATEQSPVSVVVTNLEGNVEYVNPHFTRLTGYSLEETVGRNPRMLQSGDTPRETYLTLWDTITSGGVWEGEFRNRKKSGELFWEHAIISAVRDPSGTITSYVAVKEDITERKKTEQALRESEERHRLLADNASDVIWTMDPQGHFTYLSPSIERRSGYSPAELLKRPFPLLLSPASAEIAQARFKEIGRDMAAGKDFAPFSLELEEVRADGSTLWAEVSVSALFNDAGLFIGALGVSREIGDRKRAQEEVAAQLDELLRWQSVMLGREDRVQELKREVNQLSRRLGLPAPYAGDDPGGAAPTP